MSIQFDDDSVNLDSSSIIELGRATVVQNEDSDASDCADVPELSGEGRCRTPDRELLAAPFIAQIDDV